MSTTSDRNDPRLTRGVDETPREQAEVYLVLLLAMNPKQLRDLVGLVTQAVELACETAS